MSLSLFQQINLAGGINPINTTTNRVLKRASYLILLSITLISITFIVTFLWVRSVWQQNAALFYEVRNPKGIEVSEPIKIGGIDQWIHIRGRDRNNPVLLYLHGGPGSASIGFEDAGQRPLEDYFTIVQWDQRQAGKSYYPMDEIGESMTVPRMIDDTEEVMQHLRERLNKEKIFLVGNSWGTYLGMHMVKRHPEWIHAYVGVGQLVKSLEGERTLYERLLMHAKQQNKQPLIKKLEAMEPYPDPDNLVSSYKANNYFLRKELNAIAGETLAHNFGYEEVVDLGDWIIKFSPHYSLSELVTQHFGHSALSDTRYDFVRQNLMKDLRAEIGMDFDVPIILFTGAHDWHTPRSISEKWFNEINAPYKKLIWFENSSHVVSLDEPGKYLVELVNQVLPFAQKSTKRAEPYASLQ